jgi:hypothetical protein
MTVDAKQVGDPERRDARIDRRVADGELGGAERGGRVKRGKRESENHKNAPIHGTLLAGSIHQRVIDNDTLVYSGSKTPLPLTKVTTTQFEPWRASPTLGLKECATCSAC